MADDDTTRSEPALDIDWLKTIAGALAAITTAVLLSTLGAAGTLLGAALGSVAATVGTAIYSQGLARSRAKLAAVQEQALSKVGAAQSEVRRASRRDDASRLPRAEQQLAEAADMLDRGEVPDAAEPVPWRERLAGLPWKRIAIAAAGLFLVVVVVISAFEALTGRTVSSYTGGSDKDGGTSITRITGGGSSSEQDGGDRDGDRDPGQSPQQGDPSDGAEPDDGTAPTGEPSEEAPTQEPSEEPSVEPTPLAPAPTPSTVPSAPAPTAPVE